jgi:hypothetical protein
LREHPVSGSERFLLVSQLTKAAIEPRHPLRSPSITEASTLLPDDPPSHAAFLLFHFAGYAYRVSVGISMRLPKFRI